MTKRYYSALPGLLLMAMTPFALAQQADEEEAEPTIPVYDVEIIVFEYVGGVRGSREDWNYIDTGRAAVQAELQAAREYLEAEAARESGELGDDAEFETATIDDPAIETQPDEIEEEVPLYPLEFMPTDSADYRLAEQTRKMRASRDYRPLLHVGWRQPVYDRLNETTLALDRLGDLPPTLAGEASLYVNRFLHLTLNLKLADIRGSGDDAADMDTLVFQLRERRKMRSAELHFFDHPRFGALALISRTEETRPVPALPEPAEL